MTLCNCYQYPHIVEITGQRLQFSQRDVDEEKTVQVNDHLYIVRRVQPSQPASAIAK